MNSRMKIMKTLRMTEKLQEVKNIGIKRQSLRKRAQKQKIKNSAMSIRKALPKERLHKSIKSSMLKGRNFKIQRRSKKLIK